MYFNLVITAAAGMEHIEYESSSEIRHIVYSLLDVKTENIGKLFNTVHETLERELESGSVLVHCAAGISRVCLLLNSQRLLFLLIL